MEGGGKKMAIEVICETCGKSFLKTKSEVERSNHNYCSYPCSYKGKEKNYEKKCLQCGVSFSTKDNRKIFCSHGCAQIYNNIKRGIESRVRAVKICPVCQKQFYTKVKKQIVCSRECAPIYRRKKTIEKFLCGKLTDKQVRGNTVREYLLEKQENKCAICGNFPEHNGRPLVFIIDHIDGNFSNNIPENIRAICPNCNSQTDTFSGKNMGKNGVKRHKQYRS
jgi:hypothetical protein